VGLHSLGLLVVVRATGDHPTTSVCVPGSTNPPTLVRILILELEFRQLAYIAQARGKRQSQSSRQEALQQLLHEDTRDFQIVTPPAVSIRAFHRELGTPRREIYLRALDLRCLGPRRTGILTHE
jgi:hypothetical protein